MKLSLLFLLSYKKSGSHDNCRRLILKEMKVTQCMWLCLHLRCLIDQKSLTFDFFLLQSDHYVASSTTFFNIPQSSWVWFLFLLCHSELIPKSHSWEFQRLSEDQEQSSQHLWHRKRAICWFGAFYSQTQTHWLVSTKSLSQCSDLTLNTRRWPKS